MDNFCPLENYFKDYLLFLQIKLFIQAKGDKWLSSFIRNLICRFWRLLSNFKNWIFYSLEHNFLSKTYLINDPSKFKFIFPLSNAKELIFWKFIGLEKIHFKERNLFLESYELSKNQLRSRKFTLKSATYFWDTR